jgi:hypothetical protein
VSESLFSRMRYQCITYINIADADARHDCGFSFKVWIVVLKIFEISISGLQNWCVDHGPISAETSHDLK